MAGMRHQQTFTRSIRLDARPSSGETHHLGCDPKEAAYMQEQQLKAAPFNLDAAAIAWVRAVFSRLSEDDKVRQLFNLRSAGDDPQMLARQQAFRAGSVTRVPGPNWAAER